MSEPVKPTPASGGDSNTPARPSDTRQQAADVTRQQIERIYRDNAPNQLQRVERPEPEEKKEDAEKSPTDSPYTRTHQDNYDWREYHSAWQDYYQEYYRRYYTHLNAKKAVEEKAKPIDKPVVGDDSERVEELKKDVITQVQRRAKNIKHSHHFWPIISAAAVGLVFLFVQFNSILFAQIGAYVSPGELEGKNLVITDPTSNLTVGPEPRIIIPKINVDVPVNYDVTTLDENAIQASLEDAAVHYKLPGANSLPGQFGNTVILGHSSNDAFAQGQYKFAFVLADHMEPGDTFYLHYNGTRYAYKVTEKKIIKPTDLASLQTGFDKPMVTLVTCTPPGTAINRLLVFGEQISPDPAAATKPAEEAPSEASTEVPIPGNSPTIFEQIWSWFF